MCQALVHLLGHNSEAARPGPVLWGTGIYLPRPEIANWWLGGFTGLQMCFGFPCVLEKLKLASKFNKLRDYIKKSRFVTSPEKLGPCALRARSGGVGEQAWASPFHLLYPWPTSSSVLPMWPLGHASCSSVLGTSCVSPRGRCGSEGVDLISQREDIAEHTAGARYHCLGVESECVYPLIPE